MKCGLLVLLFSVGSLVAVVGQSPAIELYRVKVVTVAGNRLRGILDDVSASELLIGDDDHDRRLGEAVSLSSVRKVILKRNSRRKSAIQGAIIGGLVTGYLVVRSSKKNGFRSPVVYGINLVIATGGGVAAGAVLGYGIGPVSRRVIRPTGRDPDQAVENLRRQLDPFTYSYQNDVLNRIRP